MDNNFYKQFKKVIEVNTTYIITEAGHPKVYYKINPDIGYVVCNYSNTCFKLSDTADLNTKEYFVYKGKNWSN